MPHDLKVYFNAWEPELRFIGRSKRYFCMYFLLIPTYVEPGTVVSDPGHPWYQLSFSFLRTDHAPDDKTPDDDR